MRKQVLFSVMLMLGMSGGLSLCPTTAKASVQQDQTIKVSGQVVDQSGEPLIGATVRVKGVQSGVVTVTRIARLPYADARTLVLLNSSQTP